MITTQILSLLKWKGIHALFQRVKRKRNAARNLKKLNAANLVRGENK